MDRLSARSEEAVQTGVAQRLQVASPRSRERSGGDEVLHGTLAQLAENIGSDDDRVDELSLI